MSIYAIHTIKGKAPVVKLFNEYLRALRTPDMAAAPRYSMKRFWEEAGKAEDEEGEALGRYAFNHYHLRTLNDSLHSLAAALKGAEKLLSDFFKSGKSLTEWATNNRLELVKEYGGDEDDWYKTDAVDEAGEPVWAITDATAEGLLHYDLWSEAGRFFDSGGAHGEYIGASRPEDYRPSSCVVEQQSVFSFRRMIEALTDKPCNIIQVSEGGEETPVSLGQMIEDELNEDIRGANVVSRFEGVIASCEWARNFYKKMDRNNTEDYQALLQLVQNIRQLNTCPF